MQYSAPATQYDLKCEFVPCTRDCVRAILRARKCSCPAGAARRLGSPRLPKRQLAGRRARKFQTQFWWPTSVVRRRRRARRRRRRRLVIRICTVHLYDSYSCTCTVPVLVLYFYSTRVLYYYSSSSTVPVLYFPTSFFPIILITWVFPVSFLTVSFLQY